MRKRGPPRAASRRCDRPGSRASCVLHGRTDGIAVQSARSRRGRTATVANGRWLQQPGRGGCARTRHLVLGARSMRRTGGGWAWQYDATMSRAGTPPPQTLQDRPGRAAAARGPSGGSPDPGGVRGHRRGGVAPPWRSNRRPSPPGAIRSPGTPPPHAIRYPGTPPRTPHRPFPLLPSCVHMSGGVGRRLVRRRR